MNKLTRQFLNLILEEKEKEKEKKDSKEKSEKEEDSKQQPKRTKEKFAVETSNRLSKGRPIGDAGLANMKYRADGDPAEAKEMLGELKIAGASGDNWYDNVASVFNSARNGEMRALVQGASVVESGNGVPGVRLRLVSIWRDDDKGGKRSFGMIRAVHVAAVNVGYIKDAKGIRVEEVVGQDALIFYKGKKAKSWQN
jgi:hypothetical protein